MFTWKQATGQLSRDGLYIASGYSGFGPGKNNPDMQNVKSTGPIPQGFYEIGEPYASTEHGPLCLRLTPHDGNEMFGRSAFLIHGDSAKHPGEASRGCIILPRYVRDLIAKSGDKTLEVTR